MALRVQSGNTITVVAPYAGSSGGGAQVGIMFGIANNDFLNADTNLELQVEGVFDIAKDTSVFAQGAVVYWDNTNKVVTSTSTSNLKIGVATLAALTGDATARVRLNGAF